MTSSSIAHIRSGRTVADGFLPDFCSIRITFVLVVTAELLAFILALAVPGDTAERWSRLGLLSLFIQWIALCCAGVLCLGRARLNALSYVLAGMTAYLAILLVTALSSGMALLIAHGSGLQAFLPVSRHAEFMQTSLAMAAIIGAVILRYFYVQQQTRRTIEAESRARFQALQARIRPHFMFNSMNTIASLTRSNPALAEEVVEDLAELFRRSLSDASNLITLDEELELIRRYLRIESLRMGGRLRVEEQIAAIPTDVRMPALLFQPLVENAVYHGIEALPEGGTVRIEGFRDGDTLTLCVSNPISVQPTPVRRRPGNHMALANIRERLLIHYGKRGRLDTGVQDGMFRACLTFPLQVDAV